MLSTSPSRWVQALEGVFYRLDGACIATWIFDGGTFRSIRGYAFPDLSNAHVNASTAQRDGPAYETGSFHVDSASGTVTLHYAHLGGRVSACRRRSARLTRDCMGGLSFEWLQHGRGCTAVPALVLFKAGTSATIMQQIGGPLVETGSGEVSLAAESWSGTIRMHTTNCSLNLLLHPIVREQGIYWWVADVYDCLVSPDVAVVPHGTRQHLSHVGQRMRNRRRSDLSGRRGGPDLLDEEAETIGNYSFDIRSHNAYDIVHPKLCLNTRTWIDENASTIGLRWEEVTPLQGSPLTGVEVVHAQLGQALLEKLTFTRAEIDQFQISELGADSYVRAEHSSSGVKYFKPDVKVYRSPEWYGLAKMPSGTQCLGHVPRCHERASCAVFFIPAGFRSIEDSDPYYDLYMRDCHSRGAVGIFHPEGSNDSIVREWPEQLLVRGQHAPNGQFEGFFRNGKRVPPGTSNCSASLWNVTHECICDRGWVGDGRCCLDKPVSFLSLSLHSPRAYSPWTLPPCLQVPVSPFDLFQLGHRSAPTGVTTVTLMQPAQIAIRKKSYCKLGCCRMTPFGQTLSAVPRLDLSLVPAIGVGREVAWSVRTLMSV